MDNSLLNRLDARDRALFARWTIDEDAAGCRAWVALTHLGGALSTIAAAGVPLLASGVRGTAWHTAAVRAAIGLSVSHALVQLIKRNVIRERPPIATSGHALVGIPDAFSFPSGHATAAMAVALAYAVSFPAAAPPSSPSPSVSACRASCCACTTRGMSWPGRQSPS
jgi:undecaprenyl-diphosphatase